MKMNVFKEEMKLKRSVILIFLALLMVFFIYMIVQQVLLDHTVTDDPMPDRGLFLGTGLSGLLLLFFTMMRLSIHIDGEGIQFQFFPFHWRSKIVFWEDIDEVKVLSDDMSEKYRGFGIRYGKGKKAYLIGGRGVLEITFSSGQKLYLTTRRPEAVESVLQQMNRLGSPDELKNIL